MKADVYTRLSRFLPDQTSTGRQEADCRKLADLRGMEVAEVHCDVDFSAYKSVVRPGFDTLRDRITSRQVDAVVFWKIDRLARNTREFLSFVDLCERNDVAVVSVNEQLDTSSPIGRVIITILAAFAELESATIGMRVRSARDLEASNGRPHAGGCRRFGYTRRMAILPSEAALVKDAARTLLTGGSFGGVARDWNGRGVVKVGGSAWKAADVSRLLRSPHLAGLRVHHGTITEGDWEPVLDRATHEALTARKGRTPRTRRVYLLTGGLARCGLCGTALIAGGRGDARGRQYRCPSAAGYSGCGKLNVPAVATEEDVRLLVLAALEHPNIRRALSAPVGGSISGERANLAALRAIETRSEELGWDYAAGRLPRKAFLAASAALEQQTLSVNRSLAGSGRRSVLADTGPDVEAEWEKRDLEWRAKLIGAIFERIDLHPDGRVAPVPRQ